MKTIFLKSTFIFVISINSLINFAQSFNFDKNFNSNELIFDFTFKAKNLSYININTQNHIDFASMYKITSLKKGEPCLPLFNESIIIPNQGFSSFEIISSEFELIENVFVAPSKGNLKRNIDPSLIAYEFGTIYSEDNFYPLNIINLTRPYNLRSIRGQVISVSPYQYNPVTKTLKIYKNLKVKINFDTTLEGENELQTETSKADLISYQNLFGNNTTISKYNIVEEEGDLLIIMPEEYLDSVKPLIDWKHKKGIKTHVKFTSEFGTTPELIKQNIQTFYSQNPSLKYLLLVGDHQQIPAHSYGTSWDNEALISDSYYGQLQGSDYYPEVFVGRFSGTVSQVATMVRRTLEYEKNPMVGDWMTKAIGLGSSEGAGYGDDGQADWQHLRAIRTTLMTYGYSQVHEFYDGSRGGEDAAGNPNSGIILPAVNNGVGLFNYTGHGDLNSCVTGNFNSTNINNATNNGAYPFVISVACNNGTFTSGNCISETWLKATNNNSPSGAIAACGSSILMAWAPPMETQDEMSEIISHTYTDNRKTNLGALFYNSQMSMLEKYPSDGEEVMQTWVFFGDPTTTFRNKITQNLNVVHVESISSQTSYNLQFSSTVNDALISLTQDSIFIGTGKIVNGSCNIQVPPLNSFAPITVVGTLQNHKPYMGEIEVLSGLSIENNSKELIHFYPNPAKDKLIVKGNIGKDFDFQVLDLNGRIIFYKHFVDTDTFSINLDNFSTGVYQIVLETKNSIIREKLIIQK